MLSSAELAKLYEDVDRWIRELEPGWRKCFPCKNQRRCCFLISPVSIKKSEWPAIVDELDSLTTEEWQLLKINHLNGQACPFKTESDCLIHEARPFSCRLGARLVRQEDGQFVFPLLSHNCSMYKMALNSNATVLNDRIALVPVNSQEIVAYLFENGKRQLTNYVLLEQEEDINLIERLKEYLGSRK